ncbi:FUSC family protein [Methyloligella solikamskensis]|uniref:FUSC family protein n=1 Tax=Methyloligella solikamskensis TaxID=1177756 RepID=A0ABW3JEL9_9HYPH
MHLPLAHNREDLRVALQGCIAAIAAYVICHAAGLDKAGSWAVISALFVLHRNLDATLSLVGMRLVATVVGTVAGLLLVQMLQGEDFSLLRLGLGTGLLMLVASRWQGLRYAVVPVTILALSPGAGIFEGALTNAAAIISGALVGLAATILVWPRTASNRVLWETSRAAHDCRQLLNRILCAIFEDDGERLDSLHAAFYRNLQKAQSTAQEIRLRPAREKTAAKTMLRHLERLWHNLLLIDRVITEHGPRPNPQDLRAVRPAMEDLRKTASDCLGQVEDCLLEDCEPPKAEALKSAIRKAEQEAHTAFEASDADRSASEEQAMHVLLYSVGEVNDSVCYFAQSLEDRGAQITTPFGAVRARLARLFTPSLPQTAMLRRR